MNCPKCGHPVNIHSLVQCYHGYPTYLDCDCQLSKPQALLAAQRHAAAVALREMRAGYCGTLQAQNKKKFAIRAAQLILRLCGIQRPRRSEHA